MRTNHLPLWVRLLSLSLVMIMAFGVLTACNGSTGDDTETESGSASLSETESETENLADLPAATAFTVSNVFSDHMVVQRDEHVRIWGWADETQNGKRVSGEFLGTVAHTVIENGEWTLTFEEKWAANTATGNTMTIYGEGVEHTFNDVLVGDVYMVIGQSNINYNMERHLGAVTDDKKGTLDENAPIRLHFNNMYYNDPAPGNEYPAQGSSEVCRELLTANRWELPTRDAYLRFSALGYLFAEKMLAANRSTVPIGVIEVAASGVPLIGFLSNEVATATQTDVYNEATGLYATPNDQSTRYVYNRYMFPFEKYAIDGVIWYQGESDAGNASIYAERFIPLMEQMRETHNVLDKNFPIYIIELPYGVAPWSFGDVRALQGHIVDHLLPNAYRIISSDLNAHLSGDVLHPDIKWEQAERLTAVASYVAYGQGTASVLGPILTNVEWAEDRMSAVLTYENVGDGLKTIDGSEEVWGFFPYRKDLSASVALKATITAPNQITVVAKKALNGIAYHSVTSYGFNLGDINNRSLNLCNSDGIPAGATVFCREEP